MHIEEIKQESGSPYFVARPDHHEHIDASLMRRHFTAEGATLGSILSEVEWRKVDAVITDFATGDVIFKQEDVEVPVFWSDQAATIVASKYFRGHFDDGTRETSVKQLITRVVETISAAGAAQGWFDANMCSAFEAELGHMLVYQKFAFNSPVWFNVGVTDDPQASACFINTIEDTMEGILDFTRTEARLFKGGSGSGVNISPLREKGAKLSGSGHASGPVSFMRAIDQFAGVIKSGGKTRRAAKMVIMNADHPDIDEFVWCKALEERKAHALIKQGYPSDWNGPAYTSINFQNANHSIRVTNEFMRRATATAPEVDSSAYPRNVLRGAAEATWECGDPGIQFHDTINYWNPVLDTHQINGSNPCSEYMFIDNSACNLGSLNLMGFREGGGEFNIEDFCHAVDVAILAMEILVDLASYPTRQIAQNSHDFRPLGLGFANLGTLLMSMGLPYDSEQGCSVAGSITALMAGRAYARSAELAKVAGAFNGFNAAESSFRRVMKQHWDVAHEWSHADGSTTAIQRAAHHEWDRVIEESPRGFRNAQVTVLAPTGTIAFMMDCDTTGIEPELGLIKYKKLAGGGSMKIANQSVRLVLSMLDYTPAKVDALASTLEDEGVAAFRASLFADEQPIFDTAFPDETGRSIRWQAHVAMMAACQPFLSGAISKTVNMPADSTPEDIEGAYIAAWKAGLKSIAVYRDGSKGAQVLTTTADAEDTAIADLEARIKELEGERGPLRERLPDDRKAVAHKFSIAGSEGYLHAGFYPDGRVGEVFVTISKAGSTMAGLLNTLATSFSLLLQHGVPLQHLVDKFSHTRFPPNGFTSNANIRTSTSVVDYMVRWLADVEHGAGVVVPDVPLNDEPAAPTTVTGLNTGETCHNCGSVNLRRTGSCWTCLDCGTSGGCG